MVSEIGRLSDFEHEWPDEVKDYAPGTQRAGRNPLFVYLK